MALSTAGEDADALAHLFDVPLERVREALDLEEEFARALERARRCRAFLLDEKAELERALAMEDQTERQLEVVAIVSEALADIGVRPVVAGGLAVAYWTAGSYLTGDIDVLMPSSPAVDERPRPLGFEGEERFWLIVRAGLFLEAPGSFLEPGAEAQEVALAGGRSVSVIRLEDVLVGRLHEFVATATATRSGRRSCCSTHPSSIAVGSSRSRPRAG